MKKVCEESYPELLYDLMSELEGANQIHIAACLFNKPILFEILTHGEIRGVS
jgi:hypothetical protein